MNDINIILRRLETLEKKVMNKEPERIDIIMENVDNIKEKMDTIQNYIETIKDLSDDIYIECDKILSQQE